MPSGLTPIYRIEKGGEDITGHFNDRTLSIRVEKSIDGNMDVFQIEIDDRDFLVAEVALGALLSISLGYKEVGLAYQGAFEINEATYKGPPKAILLTGTSAGVMNAMKEQQIKHFDNKTVEEIIQDLAGNGGLGALVHPSLATKKIPFKNQMAQSPFHILNQLERHFDAVAKFQDGKVIFVPRDGGESVSGQSMAMVVLRPEHFGSWAVRHTSRADYGSVEASWHDKKEHKTIWEKQDSGDQSEGSESNPTYRLNQLFNSQEEAQQAAKSRMAALRRSVREFNCTLAKGDPWITDQMRLVVTGMRPAIDGGYVIEKVVHTYIKDAGISTQITAKPPGDMGNQFSDQLDPDSYIDPSRIDRATGRVAGSV